MYLQNRSELIKPTDDSKHAVIIINDVVCDDEEPSYECSIGYNQEGPQDPVSEGLSISLQKSSKRPLDIPLIQTTELQENEDLGLACVADVGKPPGIVKWWRFRINNDFTLIKESVQIPNEAGNCEFVISLNITHTVTKEDNGAFFRCTSHNNMSKDEGPKDTSLYRDTTKINVLYEALVLNIIRVPEFNVYPVSTSRLNITCIADGNPIPTDEDYKWTFQSFYSNTTEEKNSNGKFLVLQNLQKEDSGTYTCSVTNSLNSTHSSNITIIVNGTLPEPWPILYCLSNPCGALEKCVDLGQKYNCETNAMSIVGVLFVILAIASIAISFGLAYYIRKLHKVSKIGVENEKDSNGKANGIPLRGTESDLKTSSTTILSDETNGAIYAQIQKS
ncbi:cell adhesion molecule 3-like [Saccostrea echinata]|uniref:cell adhesion molecule 3-like n=1 Tax=Saccostrea echinata TaxID=191078 RepID=UPI002A7F0794|nr:cell adhesion molecule 3-like [Saccostrea echinata]